MSAPVVAVLNLKGGVGKTTVTASVARDLFDSKKRAVLMIDLDPQFNLTQALQFEDEYRAFLDKHKTILTAFEPPPYTDLFRVNASHEPPPLATSLHKVLWYYTNDRTKALSLIMGNFDLVKYSLLFNLQSPHVSTAAFSRFHHRDSRTS